MPLPALTARLAGPRPTVVVVGLGYVGLPLCVELAESGAEVLGLDVHAGLCAQLNAGRSHVGDISDQQLRTALEAGFVAGIDPSVVARADAVVICVPTPLRRTKDPDISYIVAAGQAVAAHARPGQLIVLESTTYPGTTEEVLVPMLEERGLVVGKDVAVAFSPERVDPGNPTYGIRNTPKVVGGMTPACSAAAAALYHRCCDTVHPVSTPATAETVKLLENTFRMVNIAMVNEFALICRQLGLDVWEVIDAAATKPFGFMPFRPGPGLGGHCIPIDPHYLAWKLRAHNFTARFVELADAINCKMPEHVVEVLADVLNDAALPLRGSRVLVLGVAYKANIADMRESPALEVITHLQKKHALVDYNDPYVATLAVGDHELRSVELSAEALEGYQAVVVVTDHKAYDWDFVLRHSVRIVDGRNATLAARKRAPELAGKVRAI
ncbi:MAG: nucleotide sugar dehydrogenase [Myxococcales bacterium]|nr:nucleotide sugar dehydrogenase [Myxococcales bacterium]